MSRLCLSLVRESRSYPLWNCAKGMLGWNMLKQLRLFANNSYVSLSLLNAACLHQPAFISLRECLCDSKEPWINLSHFPTSIQVVVKSIDIRKLLAPTSLRTQSCITAAAWKWRSSSARLSTTLSLWRFFLMLTEQWRRWQMLTPSLLFTLCDAWSFTDPRSEPLKTLQTSPKIGFANICKENKNNSWVRIQTEMCCAATLSNQSPLFPIAT